MLHRVVFVTTDFIGFHQWPEAAQVLPERAYLASMHRHKFFVRVEVSVDHNNRDIEYHDLKAKLDAYIRDSRTAEDTSWSARMSCEDMAENIIGWLMHKYPNQKAFTVTVSEDNENGSILTWMRGPFGD